MQISFKLLLILPIAMLTGCGSFQKKEDVTPEVVGTDYDFSRPDGIAPKGKPVWVPPEIVKGWVPARIDPKTNEWIGGHYKAAIVKEGYWATQEEAALLNVPFQSASNSSPIVPIPARQKPDTLTVTEVEQRLASLENSTRNLNAPSRTSITNQAASTQNMPVISLPDPNRSRSNSTTKEEEPSQESKQNNNSPNLDLLTSETKVRSEESVPLPKLIENIDTNTVKDSPSTTAPSVLTPSPAPTPSPTQTQLLPPELTQNQTKLDANLPPPPLLNPVKKPAPSAFFNDATNEIIVSQGTPGQKIGVETPSGNVIVTYKEGNSADISFGGKTESVTIKSPDEKIKIKID